jgi:hypothetical protein
LFDRAQLDLLEEARAALGPDDDDLLVWVLARLSVALSLQSDLAVRRRLTEEAIDLARRTSATVPLAYALASRCDVPAGPEHRPQRLADAGAILDITEATGHRELELLGRRLRVVALLEFGELAAVDAEVRRFERAAGWLRQPLREWYVHPWDAMRHLAGRAPR